MLNCEIVNINYDLILIHILVINVPLKMKIQLNNKLEQSFI